MLRTDNLIIHGPRSCEVYIPLHAQLCLTLVTPWAIAHQSSLITEFTMQEYQSGLPFPSPGDLPNSRIESVSPASPALAGGFFTTEPPGYYIYSTGDETKQ